MATIIRRSEHFRGHSDYHLVRRAQASIASYRHFRNNDLAIYLERNSFRAMARKLADHYFHKSKGLALHDQVQELYLPHLTMAPILQRLPLSTKFDSHRGHLISWFRRNANGRVRRFHFDRREFVRDYQPDLIAEQLATLGVHDAGMVEVLLDLHRRHAGGTTNKDLLAHQIFDPLACLTLREGYELRYANALLRLEKQRFGGSTDLRQNQVTVLDYAVRCVEHRGGWHLEVLLAEQTLMNFRSDVKRILSSPMIPTRKQHLLEIKIHDLIEKARWARSAEPQMQELRSWLADKRRSLAGTLPDARLLPNWLINLWYQRVDHRLYVKAPSFFHDPMQIDEKTYLTFFSPYREVV